MAPSSGQARAATNRDPQHAVFSFVEQSQEGSLAMIGPYCVACMNILHIGGRFAAAPPAIFIHTSDGGRQLTMDDLILTNGSLEPFLCRAGTADKNYLLLDCVRPKCKTVSKVNTRDVSTEANISGQPAVIELSEVISTQFARTLTTREGYAQTKAPKLTLSDVKAVHCVNRANRQESGTQTVAVNRSRTQDQSSQAQLSVEKKGNGSDFLTTNQMNTLKRIVDEPTLQTSLNSYLHRVERSLNHLAKKGKGNQKQPTPVPAGVSAGRKRPVKNDRVDAGTQKLDDSQPSSTSAKDSDQKPDKRLTSAPLLHGNKNGVALTDEELEANLCRLDDFMSCFNDSSKEELLRLIEERNWLANDCRVCEKITASYLDHVASADHLQKLKTAGCTVTSSEFSELEVLLLTCMKKMDVLTGRELERFTKKNVPFLLGTMDESKKLDETELFCTIERIRNDLALFDTAVVAKFSVMQFQKQTCKQCNHTTFADIITHVTSDEHIEKIANAKRFFSRWDVMTMTAFLRDVKRGSHATKGKTSDRGRWFQSAVIVEAPQSAPDVVLSATTPSSTSTAAPTKSSILDASSPGPSAKDAAVSDNVVEGPPPSISMQPGFAARPFANAVVHCLQTNTPSQPLCRLFHATAAQIPGKRLTVSGIEQVIHYLRRVFTDSVCAQLCEYGGDIGAPKTCSLGCPTVYFPCFCAALKHFLSDSHIQFMQLHFCIESDFLFLVGKLDDLVIRSKRAVPGWDIVAFRIRISMNSIVMGRPSMNAGTSKPAQSVPPHSSSRRAQPSASPVRHGHIPDLLEEELGRLFRVTKVTTPGKRLTVSGIRNVMNQLRLRFPDSVCSRLCEYTSLIAVARRCSLGCMVVDISFPCFCAAAKHLFSDRHIEVLQRYPSCSLVSDYLKLIDILDAFAKRSLLYIPGWNKDELRLLITANVDKDSESCVVS